MRGITTGFAGNFAGECVGFSWSDGPFSRMLLVCSMTADNNSKPMGGAIGKRELTGTLAAIAQGWINVNLIYEQAQAQRSNAEQNAIQTALTDERKNNDEQAL
jgi:hypothetical protein